jgi:hypothetical protein
MFMFLESLHTYSIVAFVIKKNGILTKNQNLMLGWGVPLAVVFVITIYFKSYLTKINKFNKNIFFPSFVKLYPLAIQEESRWEFDNNFR